MQRCYGWELPRGRCMALRLCILLLVLAAGQFVLAEPVAAQSWPEFTPAFPAAGGEHAINRGPGFYFAIWKIVLFLLLFWMWVRSADFVSKDTAKIGESIGMP